MYIHITFIFTVNNEGHPRTFGIEFRFYTHITIPAQSSDDDNDITRVTSKYEGVLLQRCAYISSHTIGIVTGGHLHNNRYYYNNMRVLLRYVFIHSRVRTATLYRIVHTQSLLSLRIFRPTSARKLNKFR